jgi:hypothetical protein
MIVHKTSLSLSLSRSFTTRQLFSPTTPPLTTFCDLSSPNPLARPRRWMLLDIAGYWMLDILIWEREIMKIGRKKINSRWRAHDAGYYYGSSLTRSLSRRPARIPLRGTAVG